MRTSFIVTKTQISSCQWQASRLEDRTLVADGNILASGSITRFDGMMTSCLLHVKVHALCLGVEI